MTDHSSAHFATVKPVSGSFDQVVERARQALADQGFGILSEIDVSAALKKRLGVDHPRTLILGACNPPLALRALMAVPDVAVFLPCNVVVREDGRGGIDVAVIKVQVIADSIDDAVIGNVAREVQTRLDAALQALA
ncbi:MAG: DUF302 domain-containing protein [Magnetococcales bacterium]|nr:DUF302 domain-containing protein [Magnetococcales bacterium]